MPQRAWPELVLFIFCAAAGAAVAQQPGTDAAATAQPQPAAANGPADPRAAAESSAMDTPKADNTATSAAATTTATVQPAASPVNAGPSAEQIKEARNNGFKVRGSGAHTRFCKYEAQIGSRIETETCMNPEQLGEYLVRAQQQRDQVSRVQSGTCSGPGCAVH